MTSGTARVGAASQENQGAKMFGLTCRLSRFIALGALIAFSAPVVQAQTTAYPFDLPAQPLAESLRAVGHQTSTNVMFEPRLVKDLHAPALRTQTTTAEAIRLLLEGTQLSAVQTAPDSILIQEARTDVGDAAGKGVGAKTGAVQGASGGMRVAQADNSSSDSSSSASGQEKQNTSDSSENSGGTKLEEIVVTAEKREESARSLPIAISAFSGEILTDRGIEGLESLQQIAPSMQVNVNPGFETIVTMRGIRNLAVGGLGEPAVSFTQDGLAYANSGLYPGDFFDVERVEVLRGPQGTISGRNATAGAIHIHSNRPTDELEGRIKTTLGNYERLGVEGYLSGPIIDDRLLGRLAVRTDRADGWVTNTLLDQELGTIDKAQARASFLARFTDNFEAVLILEALRDRSTPAPHLAYVDEGRLRPDTPTLSEFRGTVGFDRDSHTIQLDDPYKYDAEQYQALLRLTWALGPSAQLTAVTGYVDREQRASLDIDGTSEALLVANGRFARIPTTQASQEVTLTSDLTDRLDMLVGALYSDVDFRELEEVRIPAFDLLPLENFYGQKLTSWAGYTQWRYRLTDEIRLTAGTRYTHDSKDFGQNIFLNGVPLPRLDIDGSWNAWTPRFAVDYAPRDDLTLYASVSRGFKSGGISDSQIGAVKFDPEYVLNYEAGVKADWWDGRLQTHLTGFYMDYTDMQLPLVVFNQDTGTFLGSVVNLSSATNLGVELELHAQITDRFRVDFAGTWLDATVDELRDLDPLFPELGAPPPDAPDGPNFRDLSGNRLPEAPEWQFNVSAEYRMPLALGTDLQGVLRASYAWQDSVFFTIYNHEALSEGAYGLINLFGAIETIDERWQLSAFVYNLTDQDYATRKVLHTTADFAGAQYRASWVGAPRRYGISLAYRF